MNILITGIHGFVGTNLVTELSKDHQIFGVDIIKPKHEGVIATIGWDEHDKNEIPSVDVIIHLAGKAHDIKNEAGASVYFEINTGLTKKIHDYFLSSSASKLIFFSSVKAAADKVEGILTEDVDPSPVGPYGESKHKAEKYIINNWPAADSGKSVYILRPCMIHGPGNKGNLNLLYNIVSIGIPWPLGAFNNQRSFTSIDNLSYIIRQLIERDIHSGIYNIADDEPLSTNQLITLLSEAMGLKPRIWNLPKGLMNAIATTGSLLHFPLTKDRLQKLTESYVVSNAKIKEALGLEKMPISSTEGLKRTIQSFCSPLRIRE